MRLHSLIKIHLAHDKPLIFWIYNDKDVFFKENVFAKRTLKALLLRGFREIRNNASKLHCWSV